MTTDREFTERLTEEIASWRRDGLINAAQARAIMARYGLTWGELDDTRRQGRLAAVVTTLGAVLTGIGVILFVASNWGELGRAARLVLLLLALGVAYGLGFLADRRDHPRVGASLIFLGSLIFGANVFLVAQTYHVQAGSPWLLLFWAAGATATAYTAGSRPSMYLAVIAMLLWYVFQLVEWDALSRGAQTRAVSTAAILPLGLLSFSLGSVHRRYDSIRRLAGAYTTIGTVTQFTGLLVFSFADVWRGLGAEASGAPQTLYQPVLLAYLGFSLGALLLTAVAAVLQGPARQTLVQAGGVVLLWLASLLVIFHPFDDPGTYGFTFNLIFLAAVIWGVALGIWTRQESLINLSILFFAFQVLARYFDFFFTLFDRSLVFIGAGILLLVGGWLVERSRRTLIAHMQSESDG